MLAGCAGDLTQAQVNASGCPPQASVGQQFTTTISVTNTGGSAWPRTFLWIDGADSFVRDQLSDDQGATGVDQGANVFQFGSLPSGGHKSITLVLTAKSAGTQ